MSSELVVDDKVYIGDEDGDVTIFQHSPNPTIDPAKGKPITEIQMDKSIYSTLIVAINVLYVACRNALYAIEENPVPK